MAKTFYYLLKEVRPRQWIKNLSLFAAIFFTGELLNPEAFLVSLKAFIIFCAVSSVTYIFNDLRDIEKDRLHPFKKNRPLASGRLNANFAKVVAVVLTITSVIAASQINLAFLAGVLAFYLLQIAYSIKLKEVILLDILTIAAGFILRVFAGELASGYHIDVWLFLTVVSTALFIAIGKRRSELTLLSGWSGTVPVKTRATLSRYSERMLDVYLSMFANSAWLTYAFYTFLQRPPVLRYSLDNLFYQYNLDFLSEKKWLMVTIPLVIYGVMRYLQLIYEKNEGESPEKVLLSDRPLIFASALLGITLFGVIYIIRRA